MKHPEPSTPSSGTSCGSEPWNCELQLGASCVRAYELPAGPLGARWLIDGLPQVFHDELLLAAQSSTADHTWCVRDELPEGADRGRVLEVARGRLKLDLAERGLRFVTFARRAADGGIEFVGCAALRQRLGPGLVNSPWYVINRALVLPGFQGRGFGFLLVPFCELSRYLLDPPGCRAAGFFVATKSPAVRLIIQRGWRRVSGNVVTIGRKRPFDVPVTVGVFEPTLRRSEQALQRSSANLSPQVRTLLEAVHRAWNTGASVERCAWMGQQRAGLSAELGELREHPAWRDAATFLDAAAAWDMLEEPSAGPLRPDEASSPPGELVRNAD
jgi:GNAT superfamily N-acetyltransferase